MPTTTRVNGRYPSFCNINATLDGFNIGAELVSIDYKDNVDRGKPRGASRQILGQTEGDYDAEASLEMSLAKYVALRARLGDRFFDVEFTITVSVAMTDDTPITTDELIRCSFKSRGREGKQGNDALTKKLELDLHGIVEDGQLPFEGFQR